MLTKQTTITHEDDNHTLCFDGDGTKGRRFIHEKPRHSMAPKVFEARTREDNTKPIDTVVRDGQPHEE